MPTTSKPLLALTAGELMTRDVVRLPQEMSVRDAARLLLQNSVGGAPVVDAEGKCVGVLSAIDILRLTAQRDDAARAAFPPPPGVEVEALPAGQVRRCMTADPVTATPQTPIRTLARWMIDAQLDRVVIVDGGHRPIGVVSSTDILAAVAYADAEQ
jgi:CBS domain-containing protein